MMTRFEKITRSPETLAKALAEDDAVCELWEVASDEWCGEICPYRNEDDCASKYARGECPTYEELVLWWLKQEDE